MANNFNLFFTTINDQSLVELIGQAQESVIFAAPGMQLSVAQAIVNAALRLGREMVITCLDVTEHSLRLGFGDIQSVELLKANGVLMQNVEHLRFALIVVDGKGYSFTPNALFLESDTVSTLGFNAIKMTPDQVREATVRLSPAAKALAIAQCNNEESKQRLQPIHTAIEHNPVESSVVSKISQAVKEAPPQAFDVSRQVRVYTAYLQYVEVSLTGAAIQRQKVAIPKIFLSTGNKVDDLEGRLNTSFDLFEKDNALSSKYLEKELKVIRENFTRTLGKKHGRVMLKSNKDRFSQEINALRTKLAEHAVKVENELQNAIDESIAKIANYYLPIIKADPPQNMIGGMGDIGDNNQPIINWIIRQLEKAFPKVESMVKKMELSVIYKDVTFENLNDDEFSEAIEKAYPDVNWDKAYNERIAAAGKNDDERESK